MHIIIEMAEESASTMPNITFRETDHPLVAGYFYFRDKSIATIEQSSDGKSLVISSGTMDPALLPKGPYNTVQKQAKFRVVIIYIR